MNDPNNVLYSLRSNYYRNNYSGLTGLENEVFKLKRFPLFRLLNELPYNEYDTDSIEED